MSHRRVQPEARIGALLSQLPREIVPPEDSWPSIEETIRRPGNSTDELLARVPADVPPPAESWAAIEDRLTPADAAPSAVARAVGNWRPLAAACLAIAAIAAALVIGPPEPVDPGTPSVAQTDVIPSIEQALAANLFDAGSGTSAVQAAALEATRETYLGQIAEVRNQRRSIEESVALYPNDPRLRALWLHAYETELGLIDEAGRVLTRIQTG